MNFFLYILNFFCMVRLLPSLQLFLGRNFVLTPVVIKLIKFFQNKFKLLRLIFLHDSFITVTDDLFGNTPNILKLAPENLLR